MGKPTLVRLFTSLALALPLSFGSPATAEDYADPEAEGWLRAPSHPPRGGPAYRHVQAGGLEAHRASGAPLAVCPSDNFDDFKSWFAAWSTVSALPYAMYPEPPGYQILDVTIPPGTVRTFDITPPYQVLRFALCAMAQDIHVTVRSATLVSDQDYCEAQNLTDLPCELDNELPVPLNELQITQSERTRNSPLFNWGTRYRVTTLGGSARIFIAGRLGEFPSLQVTQ